MLFSAAYIPCLSQTGKGFSRAYTDKEPLIYEDAWDLWPYVFLDDTGQPSGFNVDLVRMIMDELNIPYEIRLKPTKQALEDLSSGRSDLMLGMMAGFHDDFTEHYSKSVVHLFTHSVAHPSDMEARVTKLDDLAREQVIVHDGSFSHHLMQDRGWALNAQPFGDMALAVQMVSAENNGQVLWNTMSLKWLLYKFHAANLVLSPVDMPSGEYRFLSNDSTLLAKIDETFARLKADERLQPLEMKWFYPEVGIENVIPAWMWFVFYALLAVALMLALVTVVFHIRERRATADGRLRINRLAVVLKLCKVSIWTYDVEKDTVNWYGDDARSQVTMSPAVFARRYWPGELEQLKTAIERLKDGEIEEATLQMHISEINNADNENHIFRVRLAIAPRISADMLDTPPLAKEESGMVIMCTERDVTEETVKQRKADELMHRYRAVFNTAMVDMIYCDKDGYLVNMNMRAQHTFNYTLQRAISGHLNIKDFFPGEDIINYRHVTVAMTPEGAPMPEGQMPNSLSRFYEMQVLPVYGNGHKPLGIFATGREVTEVARTYLKARNGLEQLRAALDKLDEYVDNINYVLQVGGVRIVTYSPYTHELTIFHRMHEAQYVLTQQRCLSLTAAESLPQMMRVIRAMDRRANFAINADIRTRLRVKGGLTLCLQLQMFPIADQDGTVTVYEGVCRDVTEIKHTEQLLKQETEKAQEVEQLKMKFLHNMCSAIRTPLDTVVKSAEMFEKEHDPSDEAEYIDTIKDNSAYLLNLVNDILFLSRLDAHMVEVCNRETDFAKTIEGLCHNGWIEGRKEGVSYEVENLYEELVVNIDLTNIGHVMQQVIQNAVHHTDSGRVRVRYEYIGGNLVVGVDDTGEGMSKDILDHVFDRFSTPTGKTNSTGLGLPICNELVMLMGGHIDITSEVGKGTTVWITIPCEAKSVVRK